MDNTNENSCSLQLNQLTLTFFNYKNVNLQPDLIYHFHSEKILLYDT